VLTNELKRARALAELRHARARWSRAAGDRAARCARIAGVVSRELRETDLLAVDEQTVSIVLLDADVQSSAR
jgi:hypothetical protein